MLAAAVASCTKETTPERINIQHPDQQSPILRDNAYYQNLRAYKQTKHKLAFGWYGSWTAVGASYQSRLISAPDSMDIISIWSQWHTLTPQQMADKEFVQKTLGTKVTYTIFSDKLPEPFLEIGNGEYTDEAIEAYAKAYCKDSMDKYQYDGIDIDYEPGYGASGPFVGHDNALFTKLINAMSKYVGPKSGTGRLLIIDGVPYAVDRSVVDCFDYGIVQAYASSGYTDLQNRFNNADAKGWKPEQYIFAENFESYWKTGGVNFTDREGNRMPSLYGMATFNPTQGAGAGFGAYHMEYEYGNSAMPYQFMRNAIQMANPAGGWKTPIDVAFSSNQSSNFSFVVEDDGSVTGTMQDKVSLSFSRPVVSGMQLTLGVDNSLVAVYNDENGTEYETVDPSLVKMEPIQCAENQVFSPDATITLDPKSIEKGYYLIPVVISPISDAGYAVKEGSVHYIFVTKVAMDVEIGATTLDEYRENIESDSALERRFQKVVIEPTTPEQTLQILRNIAPHYERHHKVHYTEEALQACVTLTGRYVTDRYFPDKAIDALDEAGSRAHLQSAREPEELRAMKTALSDARRERREAVEALVYEKAASARMREIALRSKLGESRAEWKRSLESNPVEITARHIQEVITAMTGIPAERVSDGEMIRLQTLREHLAKRVVGQQEAVEKISRTIRRSRAGLKDENRPIGVFLFVGPTGVGKTLLAKEVSKWLFDERRGLIRIDMSEYGEKHNVARLIGSPPGYVGYGEGGQLTEAVRRQPYAVVLFDEIEKAHPEVFNAMLQIFDEGHLTDGSGRKVDFRNTIIIMTSNVGSRAVVRKSVQVGYSTTSKSAVADRTPQSEYCKALEHTFAPEFLNRIDDIVLFRTLEIADVERIVDLELQGLMARTGRLGYKVKITEGAKRRLAAMGYESRYGVRSLKRTLMDNVEEPLSTLIIDGKLHEGDTVIVESDKGRGVKLRVA